MENAEILSRFAILENSRKNVEASWNDVETFIMPLRLGDFYMKPQAETAIHWDREELYDTTAIMCAQKMAASMHGSITNATMKWWGMDWTNPELNKDPESRAWLDEVVQIAYAELYESNFDTEISAAYQDLVGPGNTCMTLEPEREIETDPSEWAGVNFTCLPLREIFFEQDHRGHLAVLYRRLQWTPRQIQTKFPGVKLPEAIEDMLKSSAQIDVRIEIIYCIWYREAKRRNMGKFPMAEDQRPIGAKYVLRTSGETIGEEKGLYEMPGYITRYEKTSGSMWGFGPGVLMAPTAKYLNGMMQMEDMAIRKMIDPPSLVTERNLMSDLDQRPGGMTLVRDIDKSIKVFLSEGRIDFSQVKLKELRDMIRSAFKEDELQLRDSPQMSATEAQIRYELMNRVLGPTMARIQNELLAPMLNRLIKLLWRNKQLPPVPALVTKKKSQWKFTFSGPLVRAQKVDEVTAIERWIGSIGGAAKVFPQILNVVNQSAVAREMAVRLGIPGDLLNSEAQVAQIEQQQQAQQQAMAKAQAAQETGKGMQEVAKGAAAHQALQGQGQGQ